jgi:hypothetical protein
LWQQYRLKSVIADIQSSFPAMIQTVADQLSTQSQSLNAKLSQINAVRLEQFSTQAITASQRIERAAIAIGELCTHLLSEDALQSASSTDGRTRMAPEEYAPEDGTRYVDQSKIARNDTISLGRQLGDKETVQIDGSERYDSRSTTGGNGNVPNIYNLSDWSQPQSLEEAVGNESEE